MSDDAPELPATSAIPSPLFADFVDQAGDKVLGFVAFGIYEQRKREWAMEVSKRTGAPPTADDLSSYHAAWTAGMVQDARDNAAKVLATYADEAIAQATPSILRDVLKGSVWRDVGVALLAAVLYTLLLIGLVVVLTVFGVDLMSVLNAIKG